MSEELLKEIRLYCKEPYLGNFGTALPINAICEPFQINFNTILQWHLKGWLAPNFDLAFETNNCPVMHSSSLNITLAFCSMCVYVDVFKPICSLYRVQFQERLYQCCYCSDFYYNCANCWNHRITEKVMSSICPDCWLNREGYIPRTAKSCPIEE